MNDEQCALINAFNDGQLDDVQAENVKRWLAQDPGARAYLQEVARLDRRLADAFNPVMQKPMPAGLVALLQQKRRRRLSRVVVPVAVAASLALTAVLVVRQDALQRQLEMQQQLLQMSEEVASLRHRALENTASGDVVSWSAPVGLTRAEVRPLQTYRTADSQFCRSYEERVEDANGVEIRRGVACRAGKGVWSDLAQTVPGDKGDAAGGPRTGINL